MRMIMHGPAGVLEGALQLPSGSALDGIAVVCHPHPLHEGTMDNKVVHTLARAFAGRGIAALRFNFRGVGDSAGTYDGGDGETGDALAAVAALRDRCGDLPLWLAGFSFGAHVALRAAQTEACRGLVMVAPPVSKFDFSQVSLPDCPCLVIQGDADDIAPPDDVVEWVNDAYPAPALTLLPGVGHFFHGRLNDLKQVVTDFVDDA